MEGPGTGWGDCEDEGGHAQICAVYVHVFWEEGVGEVGWDGRWVAVEGEGISQITLG